MMMQDISSRLNVTEGAGGDSKKRSYKAIVDCNSFYCSCERLFRPDLMRKPVVVLSNNDGCIVSRSDEAKKIGIAMAKPYFMAKSLIQQYNVAVFSSNYHLYGDLSWRVMESLRMLLGISRVEVYSVDEAFVDLPEMHDQEIPGYALFIRHTIEQWTGISVSVGVAPTKTLAKAANYLAKQDKRASNCIKILLSPEQQKEALQSIRINNLWGIGSAYAGKLISMGITSAWELRNMPVQWAYKNLGGVTGVRLVKELRGESCIGMRDPLTTKKMIATTRMFGNPVSDICAVKEAIATYTARAAEKLRRQHGAASVIRVFIVPGGQSHTGNAHHESAISSYSILPVATSITQELIKPALQLTDQLYESGKSYKKAGVILSGIIPDTSVQGNLFVPYTQNRNRYLMDVMDNINFSMRDDILKFAAAGTSKNWKMRQELRSPRYTTRWNEMFEVK